jgi:GNAT superfamily N-acetyltransferase
MTEIRAAEPRDYEAYVRLFRELGVDDPIPGRDHFTSELGPGLLVYERGGDVVGYTAFHKLAVAGHVRNLAVAPEARRCGVGRALMEAAAAWLRAQGAVEWHLNVKIDNAAAIGLYESLGMIVEHRSTFLRLPWAYVDKLPAATGELVASRVDPSDDDELERAFGLLSGRLAMGRNRPQRVFIQLRDASCAPTGVARFDPDHPGAYPFCVARPEHARALLEALRPYARPQDAWLGVAVEDDAALTDTLVAAGAEIRIQLLHYHGVL